MRTTASKHPRGQGSGRNRLPHIAVAILGLLVTGTLVASATPRPQGPTTGPTPDQIAAACNAPSGPTGPPAFMPRAPVGTGTVDTESLSRKLTPTAKGMPPTAAAARRRTAPIPDTERCTRPGAGTPQLARHAECCSVSSSKMLNSGGGPVQSRPRVYLVLWGPSWPTTAGDPFGVGMALHTFYSGLVNSNFVYPMSQYSGGVWGGRFTSSGVQYKGWLYDPTPVRSVPSGSDIKYALERAVARTNDASTEVQYVIATPNGVIDLWSLNAGACGWHSWANIGGRAVTYTMLPYNPYISALYGQIGSDCGVAAVNGWYGINDGTTMVAAHEFAETVTDPLTNNWYDSDGAENGDKCAWRNMGNVRFPNGHVAAVQPHWSNFDRSYYGHGCLLHSN